MNTTAGKPKSIRIDLIRTDGGTQSRELDPNIVNEYVNCIKAINEEAKNGGPKPGKQIDVFWRLSPRAIFADFTRIGDQSIADRISRRCLESRCVAMIDHHPKYGLVFHTLDCLGHGVLRKDVAKAFDKLNPPRCISMDAPAQLHAEGSAPRNERDIEHALAEQLREQGRTVRRQFRCAAGVADIVTDEAVYEVELLLNRKKFYEAIGQSLLYRQSINPALRAVIVGRMHRESESLVAYAEKMGVEVMRWPS